MKTFSGSIFCLLLATLGSQVLNSQSVEATSILRPGDQLNSTWNLVSDNGNFTLGFFTIPRTNYSYLGLWYTNDEFGRKVWVGNPNRPLKINDSGVLTLDTSGTLKIDVGGNPLMNISHHFGTSNTTAILEDSGNFVLVDAVDNTILWQSFDHPTDTLLPGMKLGFNHTTGESWTLISWLSDYVPASGTFTLSLEAVQDSIQLVIHQRGEVYWTSGPWNYNSQSFQFTHLRNDYIWLPYNSSISFIRDNDGISMSYDSIGESTSMLQLNPTGQISEATGIPINPDFCYGYEKDNGCTASAPTCRSSGDTFVIRRGFFPSDIDTNDDNSSVSVSDCRKRCWNDCGCVGFSDTGIGTTCTLYYGEFFIDETGDAMQRYVLVSSNVKSKSWIWILIALVIFIVLLASGLVSCLLRRHRRQDEERKRREELLLQMTTTNGFNKGSEIENNGRERHNLKIFSFSSIMVATKKFSIQNKLGEGGFGPVYKLHIERRNSIGRRGLILWKVSLKDCFIFTNIRE